jgi:hypothetical protein
LFKECKDDAVKYCNAKAEWADWTTDVDNNPLVLPCLYHHIHEQDDNYDANGDKGDKSSETVEVMHFFSFFKKRSQD